MPISRAWRYWSRRLLRVVLQARDSPRQIAGGAAIGTFVGITPTLGLHMILAVLIATAARCSRLPALICVYITNPITALPIWGLCYKVGCWILIPMGFVPLTFKSIRAQLAVVPEGGHWNFWHTCYLEMQTTLKLGWRGMAPLALGSLVVGAFAAVAAYWIVLRLVTGHRLLKAQRVALRAQKRIARVRRQQEFDRLVSGDTEP